MDSKAKPGTRSRLRRVLVLVFFFSSGAASLVLEVVWTRILGAVFGNTVFAATTVLTAFMLGLALGSAVLGRLADKSRRPLFLYGCLEIGVGLFAFLFPVFAAATDVIYRWFYRFAAPGFASLSAVRFVFSMLMLIPPAFLMGGTLPVLGRYLGVRHREPGQEVGYLYATNTVGAVVGCFLAGFVLMAVLGVRGSLFAAAGVALTVGLLAVALGRREALAPIAAGKETRPKTDRAKNVRPVTSVEFRLVLIAFAITGFCSLAYEVLWTRVLLFVLATSIYSFAIMLTTFLAGLALGSFLSARFLVPRTRQLLLWFGIVEVLVGMAALASVPLLARLYGIDYAIFERLAWNSRWRPILTRFADAGLVLLLPTLLMGTVFPIVAALCLRGEASLGRRVGQIYAANTIGCVLGSFAGGFVLLPLLGTHRSLLTLVALNFATGVVLVWQAVKSSALTRFGFATALAGVAVAAFFFTPSDIFYDTINVYHYPGRLAFIREHPTGTVTVHDLPNADRLLAVNGVDVAGLNFMLRSTQKLQGYIPLILHPNPRRVVQIGWGSGETARVGIEFGIEDYTAVEICPAVFEAGPFFEEVNGGSYRNPRIRRIIMDGKNFAALSAEKFDIIMNDSTFPGAGGSSALYTVDHFRHCRERLAEGGLFSCWVPLDLRPSEIRMILKSFQEVFPHTSLWVASNCLNKHALILGSLTPLRIDFARVQSVISRPAVAADLAAVEIRNVYDFLDCHLCNERGIRELTRSDPLNTDDRPRLEISCAAPKDWRQSLALVFLDLLHYHSQVTPYVENFVDEERDRTEIASRFLATSHIFTAQVAQLTLDASGRRVELEEALKANPEENHVKSCMEELQGEVGDLRKAASALPTNLALQQRLADGLFIAAHQPGRGINADLYREAAAIYRDILKRANRADPGIFCRLAEILFSEKQPTEAERVLKECLAKWPRTPMAHDLLGGIYLKAGQIALARQHIEEALRLAPGNALYEAHRNAILASGESQADTSAPKPK